MQQGQDQNKMVQMAMTETRDERLSLRSFIYVCLNGPEIFFSSSSKNHCVLFHWFVFFQNVGLEIETLSIVFGVLILRKTFTSELLLT